MNGEVVNDAVYERNLKVERLNATLNISRRTSTATADSEAW